MSACPQHTRGWGNGITLECKPPDAWCACPEAPRCRTCGHADSSHAPLECAQCVAEFALQARRYRGSARHVFLLEAR